jgi:PAS domain S-box-containing protein
MKSVRTTEPVSVDGSHGPFDRIIWKDRSCREMLSCDRALMTLAGDMKDSSSGSSFRFERMIHPLDIPNYIRENSYINTMDCSQFVRQPYRIIPACSPQRWILETVYLQRVPEQQELQPVSYLLDITGSGHIEADKPVFPYGQIAAREQEVSEVFKVLADMTPSAIMIYQHDMWVYVNDAAVQITEYSKEELLAMHYGQFAHPAYRKQILDWGSRRQSRQEQETRRYQFKILTKKGKERWVDITGATVRFNGAAAGIVSVIDITEQMDQLERLRQSEQSYRFLSDMTFEAIVTHKQGIIQDINGAFERITGYTREEAIGKDLLGNIDDAAILATIKEHVQKDHAKPYEIRATRKDGSPYWAEIEGRDVSFQGETIRIAAIRDITDRKRADAKLLENARMIDDLLDKSGTSIMIFAVEDDGTPGSLIRSNASTHTMLMLDQDSSGAITPLEVVRPGYREDYLQALVKLQHEQHVFLALEMESRRHEVIPVELDLFLIKMGGRNQVLQFAQNVTERTTAQQVLRQEQELLQGLLESISLGIAVWHADGTLQLINSAFFQITGYTADAIQHEDLWYERAFPFEEQRMLVRRQWDERNVSELFNGERTIVRADGKTCDLELRGTRLPDGRAVVCIIDVTERNTTREALHRMKSLESLGKLAGGIAHDFNNLLTGIYGNMTLASLELPEEHPAVSFLKEAENSMARATNLTGKLLTFAQGGSPVKKRLRLAELIEEVVRFDLSGSTVAPVFISDDHLWDVDADSTQMQQVFSNLTINARQAMPDGGHLTVRLTNHIVLDTGSPIIPSGRFVRVIFEDDGTGIAPSIFDHLFDPYYTTKETGIGLGLSTVYSIVERHGGSITVDPDHRPGARFTLLLPAAEERQSGKSTGESGAPLTAAALRGGRALIMDDDPAVRHTVAVMLDHMGFRTDEVADGRAALEAVERAFEEGRQYVLIVMDLTIPGGMGGKEAVQLVREIDQVVPVVVYSGYAEDPVMSQHQKYGFTGKLVKPFTLKQLEDVIRAL